MNGIRTVGRAGAQGRAAAGVAGTTLADVSRARDLTRAFCDNLTPAPSQDLADALLLAVSELVTNALRHGGGGFALRLTATPEAVAVEVDDGEPRPPHARSPDVLRGGGFGWPLVLSLASGVAVVPRPGGKTVRATFRRAADLNQAA
ncbi:ATP-binding protein [Streptomyces triticirhizae]|uniref:ATP-binding protein n=1 Tax=Streptomyces triticirhizae TaxID=2483353 RepID=A0A3M2MC74_9ACTN|nr:ATP-binding protein [Streptomyces triticirhizae]RMI46235.1 ATP-binding protein [Streptomyces triticirhizae]